MKKVGLITFHRPINFGAALQSIALFKAIQKCGGNCQIINYINPAFEKAYPLIHKERFVSLKGLMWEFAMLPKQIKKRKAFRSFITKNAFLTKKMKKSELQLIENKFDVFFTGSDQVWNFKCSGNETAYFLDFVKEKPKFSYAASFGDTKINSGNKDLYYKLITSFQKISVRESSGVQIVKDISNIEAVQSLDPTLLLDKAEWSLICQNVLRKHKKEYVLVYFMAQSEEIKDQMFVVINKIKEEKGYDVLVIGGSLRKEKDGIFYVEISSPEEFVALFRDASYVVTNSFHGTAFSVNFRKNFYSYILPNLDIIGRVESFLNKIGLKERVFSFAYQVNELKDINYDLYEKAITDEVQDSYSYLRKVLSDG